MLTTEQIRQLRIGDKLLFTFHTGTQLEGEVKTLNDGLVQVKYMDDYWVNYTVDDRDWAQIDLVVEPPAPQTPEQIRDADPFAEVNALGTKELNDVIEVEEASSSTLYRRVRRLLERAFIPEPTINCIMLLVCGGEIERDRETKAVSATAEKAEAQFWGECLKEINKPELFAPSAKRVRLAPEGQCHDCDVYRKEGTMYHPSHDAAPLCDSGGRPHCTCDICF